MTPTLVVEVRRVHGSALLSLTKYGLLQNLERLILRITRSPRVRLSSVFFATLAACSVGLTYACGDASSPDDATPTTQNPPSPSGTTNDADTSFPSTDSGTTSDTGTPTDPPDADTPVDGGTTPSDAGPIEPPNASVHPDGFARLRLVAANVSTSGQKYGAPGIHILRALEPDVAMIQEMNYASNQPPDLRSLVDQAFGTSFKFVRGAGNIPNGVVSRYPFLDSGEWVDAKVGDRTFVWAKIDIPGTVDLLAVSVHLLTSSGTSRNAQASEIVTYVKSKAPSGTYVVVGGDFNTAARDESCINTFSELFATSGPYPAYAGNENTSANRSKPYDWVLPSTLLDTLKTPMKIGSNTFASGLVFDTRVYTPLSEVPPAVSGDSAASEMQHMAVARDFMLPNVP